MARLTTSETEPRPRRRPASPGRASGAEAIALVERAAAVRDGLAVAEQAPLELAAVLLAVTPRTIERVRAALADDAALRDEAVRRFVRAVEDPRPPPAAAAATAAAPRDAEALLRAARERPGGLAILLEAAPEAAAIVFGVHPDLVQRARTVAGGAAPAT